MGNCVGHSCLEMARRRLNALGRVPLIMVARPEHALGYEARFCCRRVSCSSLDARVEIAFRGEGCSCISMRAKAEEQVLSSLAARLPSLRVCSISLFLDAFSFQSAQKKFYVIWARANGLGFGAGRAGSLEKEYLLNRLVRPHVGVRLFSRWCRYFALQSLSVSCNSI